MRNAIMFPNISNDTYVNTFCITLSASNLKSGSHLIELVHMIGLAQFISIR